MGGPRDTSGVGAQDLRISIFKQLPANASNTLRRREIGTAVQLHGFRRDESRYKYGLRRSPRHRRHECPRHISAGVET
jgi:uncharacterized protein (DUF1786 family)